MSKGRPPFKERELHPEVKRLIPEAPDFFISQDDGYRVTHRILGKAVDIGLVFLYLRATVTESEVVNLAKDRVGFVMLFGDSTDPEGDRLSLMASYIRDSAKDALSRLKEAFGVAILHGDHIFLDDIFFLAQMGVQRDFVTKQLSEDAAIPWALASLWFNGIKISPATVRKELEKAGVRLTLDEVRNRLEHQFRESKRSASGNYPDFSTGP